MIYGTAAAPSKGCPDETYNCISLVAEDDRNYWWPNVWYPDPSDSYWPIARYDLSIENFVQALATRGFRLSPNDDGRLEHGFQKAVIYALNNEVKHGALQQPNGKWRSKLGPYEDIETTIAGLVGPAYGVVVAVLRRPNDDFREVHPTTFAGRLYSCFRKLIKIISDAIFSR
jgi:hypothetical protein